MSWRLQALLVCNAPKLRQNQNMCAPLHILSRYNPRKPELQTNSKSQAVHWQVGGKESKFIGVASQVSSFPREGQFPVASKQVNLFTTAPLTDTTTAAYSSDAAMKPAASTRIDAAFVSYPLQVYGSQYNKSLAASRCPSQHKAAATSVFMHPSLL